GLKIPQRCILKRMRRLELLPSVSCVFFNPLDAFQDVLQIDCVVLHNDRASLRTMSRSSEDNAASVTTSTRHPNSDSRSKTSPPGNQELVSGPVSMSKSRSLSGRDSPRATD